MASRILGLQMIQRVIKIIGIKFQQFADFQTYKCFVLRKIICIIIDDKRKKQNGDT